ncbi:MAG: VWA domain-containing protein [Phycisphaeraceae bacterium]|nr:VWA domain-containing protein [Phycisphaeraceae bacterium]
MPPVAPATLGLTFLSPWGAAIAGALAIPALLALYFLKLRRRSVRISSTRLWRAVLEEMEVNTPFQRLRLTPLFLLQLLALLCLVLAIGRPAIPGLGVTGDRLILVIDHSSVMNLTDTAEGVTRLEKARTLARDLASRFEGESGTMIVSMSGNTEIRSGLTRDRRAVRDAIESIQPTDTVARFGPLAELLEPYLAITGDDQRGSTVVYVLTPGVFADSVTPALPRAEVIMHPIGGERTLDPAHTVGITGFSARRLPQDPTRAQLFIRVSQYGDEERPVSVRLRADGQRVQTFGLDVPPSRDGRPGQVAITPMIEVPVGVELEVDLADFDPPRPYQRAGIVMAPPPDPVVVMVGRINPSLRQAVIASGVRRIWSMTQEQYEPWLGGDRTGLPEDFPAITDVYIMIFEGYSPIDPPPVNAMFFAGVPPVANLDWIENDRDPPEAHFFLDWDRDHPLLRGVMLEEVTVENPGRLRLTPASRVLVEGPGGPAIAALEHRGQRFVLVGFQLTDPTRRVRMTDWVLQASFPIFIDNALSFLNPEAAQGELGGGDESLASLAAIAGRAPVPMPIWDDLETVTWQGPTTVRARLRDDSAVWPTPSRAGIYRAANTVPRSWRTIPVNIESAHAFDPNVRSELPLINTPTRTITAGDEGLRELWPYLVMLALILLTAEWLIYLRQANR